MSASSSASRTGMRHVAPEPAPEGRPALWSLLALVAGLAGAAALAWFSPPIGPQTVEIPGWLAERLDAGDEREVVLARPDALWLMPLSVVPYLLVVVRRSLVDAPAWQLALQLLARLAVLAAVALALAQPSLQSPIRGKTLVFAIDVSNSVEPAQLARARELVAQARDRAALEAAEDVDREDRTRVALVTYAARAWAHGIDGETDVDALVVPAEGDDGLASDHAGALRLAAALVDPRTEGRVVLVSDGAGSLGEREDMVDAANELHTAGISLHTRSFAPSARDDVLVEAVHLPLELRVGQTFEVAVDLFATADVGETELLLELDGAPNPQERSRKIDVRRGRQQVKLQARVTKPGPVVFTAKLATEAIAPELNRSTGNDSAATAGDVRGRPRVLLATTDGGGPLASALRSDHLDVEVVAPGAVPQSADALRDYDLVVFSDVSARTVAGKSQQAVAQYVDEQGGGFVMIGGENSFGVGGWGRSAIERILPVRFEGERQREQPMLALVLVIDKSGSMSSEDKLDLVKEASRATASTLDPSDEIGVIAFDSRPHVLVRLQQAANRIRIAGDIRRLAAGGGTNALPALRESYLQLSGSNALVKHVILLSDGQSPEQGIDALLGDMRDSDITVSAVGVGQGAGKDFLRRVASRGRGRFYFSQDGTDVPRIFSRETREVTRNAVVERELVPRVAKNAQVLRGIDFARAPGLRGIVPVEAKPLAEVLLRTHLGDPLLVRGRKGLGQTAAFASDAKPRWAAAWIGWTGFGKLWSQIARDTMRQGATLLGGASITSSLGNAPGTYAVLVDVEAPEGFANELQGELEVVDPSVPEGEDGHLVTVPLRLSAPGRYEAEMRDVRSGQRLLRARMHDGAETPPRLVAEAQSTVSVPYPSELMPEQLEWDPTRLAALSDGSHEGSMSELIESPGDPKGRMRSRPLWPEVLWGLMLPLVVLDLLFRRVSLGVRRIEA